jgi:hypothetical protein
VKITIRDLKSLFSNPDFLVDYNGFVKLHAKQRGIENWADKKGITIDYNAIYGDNILPEFYSGKVWLISRNFGSYIERVGGEIARNFTENLPAEDLMIGYMYQRLMEVKQGSPR